MPLPNPDQLLSVIRLPDGPLKDFPECFTALMGTEGAYSNNPADPGGETMWGITERVARAYGYMGAMIDLPQSVARDIAYKAYWLPNSCDKLPVPIAYEVFDVAYNGGDAKRWLQWALRDSPMKVVVDGVIGPVTLKAVTTVDPDDVIARFNALRILYLAQLKTWPTFSKGWMRRIAEHLLQGAEN